MNLPIYADAMRSTEHELPVGAPRAGFDEVVAGLSETEALHEASALSLLRQLFRMR